MELYSYYRSSAAYRVRIALNIKGLAYQTIPINLLKGEHKEEAYQRISPQGLVPALHLDNGQLITQSPAIIEWLEETCPKPALLPEDPDQRAQVRAWASIIACDIHPIDNLRVLNYLKNELAVDDEQKQRWYHHWIKLGFDALEPQLQATPYSAGAQPGMADIYLVPQVYNALRFKFDITDYPKILSIYEACNQLAAFAQAAPENQPDAT